MKKLVVGIKRVNNVVFGKVLKMDNSLREVETIVEGGKIIEYLASCDSPELMDDCLYLCGGDTDLDNKLFAWPYDSIDDAKQVVEDIKMLVAKVNSGDQTEELTSDCGLEIIS